MPEYLSVSEYASLHGKDMGNIRRMLAAGRLEGQKVGREWIIPTDAQYPGDGRVKNGKYHNWRKRNVLKRDRDLMAVISEMIEALHVIYDSLMFEVILYGSYAGETETKESDVDIAVILSARPSKEITDWMIECVASYELECGNVLSVIEIERTFFDRWRDILPFYRNIRREGIVLWKAEA